ncbi:hypothetical protein XENORESO_005739 [Xenotaenia resolanae]|uniref:Uncharacterized protein n=1 Tax=Xenotaenia resolanae TaxID=208358 RepID=A0ABV0WK32_9TELE
MPEHLMQKIKTSPRRQHYYAYELIKTDGFKIESIMARPTESNILPPPPVTQQNLTLPSVKCSCFVIICEVTPKTLLNFLFHATASITLSPAVWKKGFINTSVVMFGLTSVKLNCTQYSRQMEIR